MDNYIRSAGMRIFDEASDSIEETEKEYPEVNPGVPVPDNSEEVESGDSPQEFADQGLQQKRVEEKKEKDLVDQSFDGRYTRDVAFQMANGGVELETPHKFKDAEETKQRLAEIEMVNQELERHGHLRRYVPSEADIPSTAQKYKDEFGIYYYKQADIEIRPSDVASYAEEKAIVALDKQSKIIKTVELFADIYANVLADADTKEAAANWLERHMVLTDDDPRSNDTFSHSFKDEVAESLANTE